MADNYSQATVSPYLKWTSEAHRQVAAKLCRGAYHDIEVLREAQDLGLILADWVDYNDGDACLYDDYEQAFSDITYCLEGDGEDYAYFENGFGCEHAEVLRQWLPFLETTFIEVEAAVTCSKMRQGEFGGCACFITKDDIEWCSTSSWLMERRASLRQPPSEPSDEERIGTYLADLRGSLDDYSNDEEMQEILDERVHDAKAAEAADINNAGMEAQARFLLGLED